jgi:hypothetical protein
VTTTPPPTPPPNPPGPPGAGKVAAGKAGGGKAGAGKLSAWVAGHHTAAIAGGAGGVALFALYKSKKAKAAGGSATGTASGATATGTTSSAPDSQSTFDSSAQDGYDALEAQIAALQGDMTGATSSDPGPATIGITTTGTSGVGATGLSGLSTTGYTTTDQASAANPGNPSVDDSAGYVNASQDAGTAINPGVLVGFQTNSGSDYGGNQGGAVSPTYAPAQIAGSGTPQNYLFGGQSTATYTAGTGQGNTIGEIAGAFGLTPAQLISANPSLSGMADTTDLSGTQLKLVNPG